ncbi:hypothetical protein QQF64_027611 [Cirrhinus molitorella]|uniref:Uncharacterized protein n=1 Tax=Cirrhinus molitorella TaxID=172907 RepID=A0ABR3NDG6_9TELE
MGVKLVRRGLRYSCTCKIHLAGLPDAFKAMCQFKCVTGMASTVWVRSQTISLNNSPRSVSTVCKKAVSIW